MKALGAGRIVFGGGLLVKPEAAVRGWIGSRAASYGGTQTVTQACGVRDLMLGAGALAAFARGEDGRDWVLAGALCDCVDLAATLTQEELPLSGRILVTALATSAIAVSAGYLLSDSSAGS